MQYAKSTAILVLYCVVHDKLLTEDLLWLKCFTADAEWEVGPNMTCLGRICRQVPMTKWMRSVKDNQFYAFGCGNISNKGTWCYITNSRNSWNKMKFKNASLQVRWNRSKLMWCHSEFCFLTQLYHVNSNNDNLWLFIFQQLFKLRYLVVEPLFSYVRGKCW